MDVDKIKSQLLLFYIDVLFFLMMILTDLFLFCSLCTEELGYLLSSTLSFVSVFVLVVSVALNLYTSLHLFS